eukprot:comp22029_c0_seq1/m.31968 comp22029_c0_seq1/g.31968  ORF comp22029_c0_seq1/g.31968 comp22029_c0_seq1/m.31968 type:complete len:814 (-) comp22029_c0_seq1:24-2465(-)
MATQASVSNDWTLREKLLLAEAVYRHGAHNWGEVSRTLARHRDSERPPGWFAPEKCAHMFAKQLEKQSMRVGSLMRALDDGVEEGRREGKEDKCERGEMEALARSLREARILELKEGLNDDHDRFLELSSSLADLERQSARLRTGDQSSSHHHAIESLRLPWDEGEDSAIEALSRNLSGRPLNEAIAHAKSVAISIPPPPRQIPNNSRSAPPSPGLQVLSTKTKESNRPVLQRDTKGRYLPAGVVSSPGRIPLSVEALENEMENEEKDKGGNVIVPAFVPVVGSGDASSTLPRVSGLKIQPAIAQERNETGGAEPPSPWVEGTNITPEREDGKTELKAEKTGKEEGVERERAEPVKQRKTTKLKLVKGKRTESKTGKPEAEFPRSDQERNQSNEPDLTTKGVAIGSPVGPAGFSAGVVVSSQQTADAAGLGFSGGENREIEEIGEIKIENLGSPDVLGDVIADRSRTSAEILEAESDRDRDGRRSSAESVEVGRVKKRRKVKNRKWANGANGKPKKPRVIEEREKEKEMGMKPDEMKSGKAAGEREKKGEEVEGLSIGTTEKEETEKETKTEGKKGVSVARVKGESRAPLRDIPRQGDFLTVPISSAGRLEKRDSEDGNTSDASGRGGVKGKTQGRPAAKRRRLDSFSSLHHHEISSGISGISDRSGETRYTATVGSTLPPSDPTEILKTKKMLMEVWGTMRHHKHANMFLRPAKANPNAPFSYSDVVRRPVDLVKLRKMIEEGEVNTLVELERNAMLMFANALMFNPVGTSVYELTVEMRRDAKESFELFGSAWVEGKKQAPVEDMEEDGGE